MGSQLAVAVLASGTSAANESGLLAADLSTQRIAGWRPSTGGAGAAEPRLGFRLADQSHDVLGRELTKTVPVHFTHAGDEVANTDDSCLSTGEWARNLIDGAD